jgi:hypothetical protein
MAEEHYGSLPALPFRSGFEAQFQDVAESTLAMSPHPCSELRGQIGDCFRASIDTRFVIAG